MRELGPGNPRAHVLSCPSVFHAAHSATRHGRCRRLLLWQLGDHGFCGDEQASNRSGILQRRADHLGRIDDAFGHEVAELARLRAVRVRIFVLDLPDYDRTVLAGVDGDLACGPGNCLLDHLNAVPLIFILALELSRTLPARSKATPPPGRMPSSTAARVACIASSTRSLRSFTSTSVAPPTRITATPPASLARRSCSFSRS